MDAIRNIETAKTTHELAQAARQDSAAMKTIAVLTMAFLPGTFLSTLLSMPSLNWDQSKHFVVYWILAIPLTVATFILWGIVIHRRRVRIWLLSTSAVLLRWLVATYAVLRRVLAVIIYAPLRRMWMGIYTPLHQKNENRLDKIDMQRAFDHIYRNKRWKEEMMSSNSSAA